MTQASKLLVLASLAGLVTSAGCIGSIGNIGGGTITGANVNGDVNARANVNQSQNQQNVTNGNAGQSTGTGSSQNNTQPTPVVTPTPLPGPTVTPTPWPIVTPTPDNSQNNNSAGTSVTGTVTDSTNAKLAGASIELRSLAGNLPNGSATMQAATDANGQFKFEGIPAGLNVQVTASKPGFTTRQTTTVTSQGQTSVGLSISDDPEVVAVTPAAGANGVDPSTTFTLDFNEPVNTADVENRFAIYVAGVQGDTIQLSSGVSLPVTYDDRSGAFGGWPVADAASFTAAWSNNNQRVTFTFRPGFKLPTDKLSSKAPTYGIAFTGDVRDAAGSGRRGAMFFHLTPAASSNTGAHTFKVAEDTTVPRIVSVTPVNKDETPGSSTMDRIRVQFSETMVLFPGNLQGGSIPGAGSAGSALNLGLYLYDVEYAPPPGAPTPPATPQNPPQAIRLWDGDATRATVELAPANGQAGMGSGFTAGSNVRVSVGSQLMDPAGNPVQPVPYMSGRAI